MIYLQLTENYRDFDKLRIESINYTQDNGRRITFDYQIYKNNGEDILSLFSKMLTIVDNDLLDQIESFSDPNLGMWDEMCIQLIQYIINSNIESGTIESE